MAIIKKSFTTGIVSIIAVIGLFAGMYGLFFRLVPNGEIQNEAPPQTAIIQDSMPTEDAEEESEQDQATTTPDTSAPAPDLSAFDDIQDELSDFDNRIEELDN